MIILIRFIIALIISSIVLLLSYELFYPDNIFIGVILSSAGLFLLFILLDKIVTMLGKRNFTKKSLTRKDSK